MRFGRPTCATRAHREIPGALVLRTKIIYFGQKHHPKIGYKFSTDFSFGHSVSDSYAAPFKHIVGVYHQACVV